MIRKAIGMLTAATMFASTVSVPTARADDGLVRLGIGLGAAIIGEAIKNGRQAPRQAPAQRNTRPQQQKQVQPRPKAQPSPKKEKAPTAVAKQNPAPSKSTPAKQAPEAASTAVASNSKRAAETMLLQTQLAAIGYAVGTADGVWGKATEDALTEFKQSRKLPDDVSDDQLKVHLAKAVAEKAVADAKAAEQPKVEVPVASTEMPPPTEQEIRDYLAAAAAEGPVTGSVGETPETASAPTVAETKPETPKAEAKPPVEEKKQPVGFTLSDDFN